MTNIRDYYDVMGVSRSASAYDLKKAFRKLAMKYHPDRNKDEGAEDIFKMINEAYQVLSDENERDTYNRFEYARLQSNLADDQGFDDLGLTIGLRFDGFDFSASLSDILKTFSD